MLDINVFLQEIATPFFDNFFLFISNLTNEFLYIAIVAFIYYVIDKEKSIRMAVMIMTNMSLNFLLKDIFRIDRPYVRSERIINKDIDTGYGYSFPSGHSQFNSGFYSSLALNFNISRIYPVLIIFVLLVGFSRMYLGVHTIADVAVGILLGLVWSIIIDRAIKKYFDKRFVIYSLFGLIGIINIIISMNPDAVKILLLYFGFIFGHFLEYKYIRLEMPKKLSDKIINFVIFIAGVFVIMGVAKFFKNYSLSVIKYFVTGMWATCLCPFICVKRKVKK